MHKTLTILAFALAAQSAAAETYRCTQERLSANGFKTIAGAQSWFPKQFAMKVEGDTVISDYYGKGSVAEGSGRKTMTFKAQAGTVETAVSVLLIERTGLYTAQLRGQSGYVMTSGAKGRCKRVK